MKVINKLNKHLKPRVSLEVDENGSVSIGAHNQQEFEGTFNTVEVDKIKQVIGDLISFHHSELNDSSMNLTEQRVNRDLSVIQNLHPRDDIEEMIITQLLTTHRLYLKCSKSAITKDQHESRVDEQVKNLGKLSRLFLNQVKTLTSYRNQGQQRVKVEHIHVSDGGQAIIGNVNTGKSNE